MTGREMVRQYLGAECVILISDKCDQGWAMGAVPDNKY